MINKPNHKMKKVAIVLTSISLLLMLIGLLCGAFISYDEYEGGVGAPMAFWIYSGIVALVSTVFYVVDGILSLSKAFSKISPLFNLILAPIFFGVVPAVYFGIASAEHSVIGYIYYIVAFVLEIIAAKKGI